MQVIRTKWVPTTNTRPSRVKAWCDAGKHVLSWDYGLSPEGNHAAVARALRDRLGWQEHGTLIGGGQADGSMAWVFDHPTSPRIPAP